jgi:hypothetical protein
LGVFTIRSPDLRTASVAFVSLMLLARSDRLRQAVRTRLLQTKAILRNGSKSRRELAVLT